MSQSEHAAPAFLPFAPTPDRDSEPYWTALKLGQFKLQRCDECRALRWPARALCNRCQSFEQTWLQCDGAASVVGWIRTHQVFAPALREAVPYRTVQVALDIQEDLLLIGGWLSDREPVAGEAVAMEIVEGPDGYCFPCWKPTTA